MLKFSLAFSLAVAPVSMSLAAPTSGTIISTEGHILDYKCEASTQGKLACEFVQILLSSSADASDIDEWLVDSASVVQDLDGELSTMCEGLFEPLLPYFRDGPGHPVPQNIIGIEDIAAFEQAALADWDYMRAYFLSGSVLCAERTQATYREFMEVVLSRSVETCSPMVNRYSQSFVQVTEQLWVVDESPAGQCGIINTSRFSGDSEYGFLWEYTAQKVITNRDGVTETGMACNLLDEAPYLYSWRGPAVRINCVFMD